MRNAAWVAFWFVVGFMFVGCLVTGCASTPEGRAYQLGTTAKPTVDGIAEGYLAVCEPKKAACIEADRAAREAGSPWGEAERVECLKPCDSKTAEGIHTLIGVARSAQLALWIALSTTATEAELEQAQSDLRAALEDLLSKLRESGALDLIKRGGA